MNGVKIIFVNNLPYDSRLLIDGKETRPKRNKNGTSEVFFETDKRTIGVKVVNIFDGQLPFLKWFLMTFVCWIISAFGIFDSVQNKKGRTVDVGFNVGTGEDASVKIKFNAYKKDGPAMQIVEKNTEVNETSNLYFTDERARKRAKIYKLWRIFFIIAAAVVVVAIFAKRSYI